MPSYVKELDFNCWTTKTLGRFYDPERDRGSSHGFPCKMSDKMGDGKWCDDCRKINKYSWLELKEKYKGQELYEVCPGKRKGWHD
jgi:hypothetical protein